MIDFFFNQISNLISSRRSALNSTLSYIDKELATKPYSILENYLKTVILFQLNNYDKALVQVNKLIDLSSSKSIIDIIEEDKDTEVEDEYTILKKETKERGYYLKSCILYYLDNLDDAVNSINTAISLNDKERMYYFIRAMILFKMNNKIKEMNCHLTYKKYKSNTENLVNDLIKLKIYLEEYKDINNSIMEKENIKKLDSKTRNNSSNKTPINNNLNINKNNNSVTVVEYSRNKLKLRSTKIGSSFTSNNLKPNTSNSNSNNIQHCTSNNSNNINIVNNKKSALSDLNGIQAKSKIKIIDFTTDNLNDVHENETPYSSFSDLFINNKEFFINLCNKFIDLEQSYIYVDNELNQMNYSFSDYVTIKRKFNLLKQEKQKLCLEVNFEILNFEKLGEYYSCKEMSKRKNSKNNSNSKDNDSNLDLVNYIKNNKENGCYNYNNSNSKFNTTSDLSSLLPYLLYYFPTNTKFNSNKLETTLENLKQVEGDILNSKELKFQLSLIKTKFSSKFYLFETKYKEKINELLYNNYELKEYSTGFIREFSIAFNVAQALNSDTVKLEPEKNDLISLITNGIAYVPFFGGQISTVLDYANEYVATVKLKNQSKNISKFGINSNIFDNVSQYLCGKILLSSACTKSILNCTDEEANNFYYKVFDLIEKAKEIKKDLEDFVLKDYSRLSSKYEILGHKDAKYIVDVMIGSGKLFEYKEEEQLDKLEEMVIDYISTHFIEKKLVIDECTNDVDEKEELKEKAKIVGSNNKADTNNQSNHNNKDNNKDMKSNRVKERNNKKKSCSCCIIY